MSIATRLPSTRPTLEPNAATCGRQVLPAATRPAALALAISIGASACADVELGCGGDACEGVVRVATWWSDDTGAPADPSFLQPLRSSLEQRANVTLEPVPSAKKYQHMKLVRDSMRAGSGTAPLDAALFNNGADVLHMTECGSPIDDGGEATVGRLRALDDDFPRGWFTRTYPSDLVTTLTCRERVYGLPIGIHRINHVVYNRRLFEEAKQDPLVLADLDQLLAAARAIQGVLEGKGDATASVFAIPFDDPDALPDALSLFFIENVMLAAGGDTEYLDYWAGCTGREPLFGVALDWVSQLSPYFNRAADPLGRTPLQRVLEGNAAMFVTGDWIMADVGDEELAGSMPFPGTQEYWVYTADVFALPSNGNADKGFAWLHAISQITAQGRFAISKGALPARLDIDLSDSDADPRSTWNLVRALPALRGDTKAFSSLGQELKGWASESFGDVTSLVDYAASQYPLLTEPRAEGSGAAVSRPCSEVIP